MPTIAHNQGALYICGFRVGALFCFVLFGIFNLVLVEATDRGTMNVEESPMSGRERI